MPDYRAGQSGRVPPHDREAERAVLGSVLLSPNVIARIHELSPEDFYLEAHSHVWLATRSLFARGDPIDIVTVGDELNAMGCLDRIGGRGELVRLQEGIATAANAEHYARIVRDKALKRRTIEAGTKLVGIGFDETISADDTLVGAQRAAMDLAEHSTSSEPSSALELSTDFRHRLDAIKDTGVSGLMTGWEDLDRLLRGLRPGDLVIVAARPSMGKSALCMNLARTAARKKPVAVYSLEMSRESLMTRLVSTEARIDFERLESGDLAESESRRVSKALESLGRAKLYIDDQRKMTDVDLAVKARLLHAKTGGLSLIVVDYLQLLQSSRLFKGEGAKNYEVGYISGQLKTLSGELKVPIVACAQLNRQPDDREKKDKGSGRPVMSDLRDSGSIEQDADIVLFLYRESYYDRQIRREPDVIELIVGKHRNGRCGTVRLNFRKDQTRFEDWTI